MASWKCFDRDRRLQLEALSRSGCSKTDMASILGCHISTIYRELRRGRCVQRDTHLREFYAYSSAVANDGAVARRSNCGASLKLDSFPDLAAFIDNKIRVEKYSPAAVAHVLRASGGAYLCKDSIYRYIHRKYFDRLRASHLPMKGIRRAPKERKKRNTQPRYGNSIEKRPLSVASRDTFGHWEMDSVVGSRSGVGETLLVLTERKTRFELIFKVPSKESASTVSVLDYLQRRCAFRQIFKTITMDNGVEFANSRRLERDKSGRRRTYCFYCHPYTSCERGSNENNNRLIRRWFRKGQSLRNVTQGDAVRVARWMNNYPRAILGWKTATENFISCCEAEGIKISPYFSQFLS